MLGITKQEKLCIKRRIPKKHPAVIYVMAKLTTKWRCFRCGENASIQVLREEHRDHKTRYICISCKNFERMSLRWKMKFRQIS